MEIYQQNDIIKIAHAFCEHQLGIIPTDTIFGYACTLDNIASKHKIYQIKNRVQNKEMGIIVKDLKQLETLIVIDDATKIMVATARDSITIVGRKNELYPLCDQISQTEFAGVRITRSDWLKKLITLTGPLYATSVNISGEPPINEWENLLNQPVDFLVTGEVKPNAQASRVYDSNTNKWLR